MKAITCISREDLLARMDRRDDIQIVNVLGPDYYHLGFIKGSLKIPFDELEARMGELDRQKDVITYCASPSCTASSKAAEKLAKHGFRVFAYEGGIKEWKEAGFPVEK